MSCNKTHCMLLAIFVSLGRFLPYTLTLSHFPDNPVMPGVLIVEALAQTGAVAVLSEEKFKGKTAYFAQINSCKFKRMVVPGDRLKLECELVKIKGPIGIGQATATVDGEIAVVAELTFAIK